MINFEYFLCCSITLVIGINTYLIWKGFERSYELKDIRALLQEILEVVASDQERYQRELSEMTCDIDDRTRRMIWSAVLAGAEHAACTPCENMISLIKAHHALFSNEVTTQEETPSLNTQKEP